MNYDAPLSYEDCLRAKALGFPQDDWPQFGRVVGTHGQFVAAPTAFAALMWLEEKGWRWERWAVNTGREIPVYWAKYGFEDKPVLAKTPDDLVRQIFAVMGA